VHINWLPCVISPTAHAEMGSTVVKPLYDIIFSNARLLPPGYWNVGKKVRNCERKYQNHSQQETVTKAKAFESSCDSYSNGYICSNRLVL